MVVEAHINNMTGINSFIMIKADIVKGENVAIKHLTQFGSNELIDAKLPVPKSAIST